MTSVVASSKLQLEFGGHHERITDIKIREEDGKPILYTASRDKTIKGWEFVRGETGETLAKLSKFYEGHGGFVSGISLANNGKYLISVGTDSIMRLWPSNSSENKKHVSHNEKPYCVLTHSTGSADSESSSEYIFTGGKQPGLNIWNTNLELKKQLKRSDNPAASITAIKAVPKKPEVVICGYTDGAIVAWNIETGEVESTMKGHASIIDALVISPDGSLCATAGRDKSVLLWDLKEKGSNKCEISVGDSVHCLGFAISAYWLAAGTDTSIVIWDILERDVILEIPNPEDCKGSCTSITWIDGFTLIAGYSDGTIRQYSVEIE
ncbi:guanine nucleotide-binding protein subunit beta-2-like 1 protein [Nematocida minor]|uniref:guanine nucleotide-binding protein subunit beta-2-like 1 protein n=1 Tax=Nematocida minor TaxID=1912983 RepID=UPI00221FF736|nr:guanine nucleotide-binding protein subunit beta-2-like 1 protein [Nematocida minor]KAI5189883.1 guanine nucleotide-binding protein subunit beta-2-like 1 protein [Nematocida minor]